MNQNKYRSIRDLNPGGVPKPDVAKSTPSRMSLRSMFVSSIALPAMRMSKQFKSDLMLDKAIALNRTRGPALPPAKFARDFDITDEIRQGIRTFTVTPRLDRSASTILYLHGGAFVFSPIAAHWTLIFGLARSSGATIVIPLYQLAPEHDWRAASETLRAIYLELFAEANTGQIIVAGDSSGGTIALSLSQAIVADSLPTPAGLVLFSPWADLTASEPSQTEIARFDKILAIDGLREAGKRWAGDLMSNDPRVSPIFGTLKGLPPMCVFTGSRDILHSDAIRLETRANAEQVVIEVHKYPEMFHVWVAAPIPEARYALHQAAVFIRRVTQR